MVGELIESMQILPPGWNFSTMSEYQLMFVRHWIERGRTRDRKSLGGLLGVYWTSDMRRGAHGEQSTKKLRELFLPLAGILNPDVLNKTLDRTLDTSDESNQSQSMTDFGPGQFLGSIPVKEYQELFNGLPSMPIDGLPPIETPKPVKVSKDLPVGLDIERLKLVDPELARHLDPDFQF